MSLKRKSRTSFPEQAEGVSQVGPIQGTEDHDPSLPPNKRKTTLQTSRSGREETDLNLREKVLSEQVTRRKRQCLEILSGQLPPNVRDRGAECLGLEEEWKTLRNMLEATVKSKEGNSCLLVGARGCGKSLLVGSVLRSISESMTKDGDQGRSGTSSSSHSSPAFYHVSISGSVQTTDRLAMREMARQLIAQGAFREEDVNADLEDEEQGEEEEDDSIEDLATEGNENGAEGFDEEQEAMAGAILSSLSNTIANIISLLSTTPSSSDSSKKPLIITLDAFDLFTSRPRQALLYCLLDAVQAGSYGAGLAIVGMTSRVDTTDLLEKRVKSRFSHRILHIKPPPSLEVFKSIAKAALLGGQTAVDTSSKDEEEFEEAWRSEVENLMEHEALEETLRDLYELSNDVRMLYRILIGPISSVTTKKRPWLDPIDFVGSAWEQRGDSTNQVLRDLTEPEMALLIATKHLQTRDRQTFNFEMCYDELIRFARAEARQRQAAGTGGIGGGEGWTTPTSVGQTPNHLASKRGSETGSRAEKSQEGGLASFADRRVALMSFNTLLSLEILLPETFVSSLSLPASNAALGGGGGGGGTGGGLSNSRSTVGSVKNEFLRVRCSLDPMTILNATKDRNRVEPISSALVKWANAHG
ncbi:hypothetical protein IE53DRAFT_387005 [Violaceomyces palustris]|uniref:Uncharacterized protein n=1 Tax=Violaceomyces palustris TaxID=1673888 RepID=A0ACD0NY85_9BASI|nr:hypothetical protein IE53DRAFT_387005 [Violaceomyces palustris]